jgi:hypothetical protein
VAVSVTNLIQGPGNLWTGSTAATEPVDTAVGSDPTTGWTNVGGTDGGVKLSIDQKFAELSVDQIVDSVGRRLTKRDIMIDTNLAEVTLANLALAMNNATAPATGTGSLALDPDATTAATHPTYFAVILDGVAPGANFRRRVIARRCLNTSKVESTYAMDKQTFIPVTFTAHYVSSSILPFHIVDQTA